MLEYEQSTDVLRDAQKKGRTISVEHMHWLVYELPPGSYDRRATPSLVFDSDGIVRRVREYPPDWRTLSDENLFALSWRS